MKIFLRVGRGTGPLTTTPVVRTAFTIFSADLSEYGYEKDKEVSLDYIQDLMNRGIPALVCSHNPIIPKLVKKLVGKKYFKSMDRELEPAQAIILHCRAGEVIACDWIDEPTI